MLLPRRQVVLGCMLLCMAVAAPRNSNCQTGPATVSIDATDAARKLFHSHLVIPARPGAMTLYYPKWIPGEHGPTGPIANLAGLKFAAGGKQIGWKRDSVDVNAFHIDIPQGANAVEVDLDYLSPVGQNGFTDAASATAHLAMISWNTLLLYPLDRRPDEIQYAGSIKLPQGWKFGTALPVERNSGDSVDFRPVSLNSLVDSPVLTGEYFKTVELGKDGTRTHQIDIVSDSQAALNMTPEMVHQYKNLVSEAGLMFGARHYNGYHWLLTLSDHVAQFGLEHHESSDDRTSENAITDESQHPWLATLLAHEYMHSWNGKYRRPSGLATGDFSKPMQGDLLWIYEGLTNYLGEMLPARSGLITAEQYRDQLAETAASMDHNTGRIWRPLSDTAVGAQSMFNASQEWGAWRRGYDYYPEGTLIWLEADVLIRDKTQGEKSLNDFLRLFHGGTSTGPALKPYALEDVINTLRQVLDYDWKGFFNTRVFVPNPHAPMGGIEGGGWKLVYGDTQSETAKVRSANFKGADLRYSLGLMVKEDGGIQDVVFGFPAEKAGLAPGMKLIAVNGRKYSADGLKSAVKQAKTSAESIELLVENTEFYKTYKVDYHGGERYPRLERDNAQPDILSEVIKPLTPSGK